jgi:hypothetical protein
VLGQDNPDTLIDRANLACTYKSQDRIDEAIAMMGQAASRRCRILGNDHPDTKSSIQSLNDWRDGLQATPTSQSGSSFRERYFIPLDQNTTVDGSRLPVASSQLTLCTAETPRLSSGPRGPKSKQKVHSVCGFRLPAGCGFGSLCR